METRHVATAIFALLVHIRRRACSRRGAGAEHSAHAALPTAVTGRGAGLLDLESLAQTNFPQSEKSHLKQSK